MQDLKKLQQLLLEIPSGMVTTYGLIAKAMNMPKKSRYVGYLLKSNPQPAKYPCYKVVRSNGEIGGYSGENGVKGKIRLLLKDGVIIKKRKVEKFQSKIFKLNTT